MAILQSSAITGSLIVSGSSNNLVQLQGSGSTVFTVNGASGQLFGVSDDLTDSLFSVNTIAGLPVIEAFADNTVKIGTFGNEELIVSESRVYITSASLSGPATFSGVISGNGSGITNLNASNISSGTISDARLPGTISSDITGNAATATALATARNIALTGAVTGNADFDGTGNISISTTATSDPTLTLAGDATGTATFTNLGNATLTVTVVNDSHTHDGRYYTESESDSRFVNVTGDTITGNLAISNAQPKFKLFETDTTNQNKEVLVSGGALYIRNLNDNDSAGSNLFVIENDGDVQIKGTNTYFDGTNTYLRSDNEFRFLTDGGSAQFARFKSIQVSTSYSGTPPDNGILFGTDTNLYRSAANTLRTNDSLIVDGDVTVGGIVTAQEFHTEFVSASIVYQSGSTKFGDTSDDVHEFTGSLEVSGPLYINANSTNGVSFTDDGTFTAMGADSVLRVNQRVEVWGGGAANNSYLDVRNSSGNRQILLEGNGNASYFLNSLGVGTSTASKRLHVSSSANEVAFFEGSSGGAWIDIQSSTSNLWSLGAVNSSSFGIYNRTATGYVLQISNAGEASFYNVVNATAINTGQGDNELYAMDQNVRTTDAVTFQQATIAGTAYKSYGSGDTDITGLVPGSTFGTLIEGASAGHLVIGIRDNDNADSFSILSGNGNFTTDSTYDFKAFSVTGVGNATVGNNLTVTNDLYVNDYARIDALRVGTTSTDPGDGNLYVENQITLGPNPTWSKSLIIGGNANNSTADAGSIGVTNGNLHIDAAAGAFNTYLNFYDGTGGVAFGNGAGGAVAWMGPDGDLWKGSSDNNGSKYWHAGNDGASSGLDADLLDGQQGSYYQNASNLNAGTISDDRLPASITSDITGNAATATKWATARTITLGGDLSGNVSIDGSANATLTATIAANSVALGTDTTGNYVGTITAGTGIDTTGATTGEGIAHTISVDVSDFMTNGANNRVVTATGTDGMNAESNLTFDGTTLTTGTNQNRIKLGVWNSTSTYGIGMQNSYTFGHLNNDYAMTFEMNDDNDRGFWFGDDGHSNAQGAFSMTTQGKGTIATSLSIGEGESVTSPSSTPLYVEGSGSVIFDVQGSLGQLFSVTDDLTGTLFSVNDISGIPILTVDSDDTVTMGTFGANTLVVTGSNVGIGTDSPAANAKLTNMGNMTFGIPGNGTNTSGRFISIEGNTDASGEGSGRIFFTEHNSSTAGMSKYGMSIGYRGGGTSIVGADGNTWTGLSNVANGEWGMWGHNNNANGQLIMFGPRDGSHVTIVGDLFVNDYARIDALRVGTTSTDPGDGNLYVEGTITTGNTTINGDLIFGNNTGYNVLMPASHTKTKIGLYGSGGAEWIGTSTATLELSGGSINLNGANGSGTPNLKMGGTTVIDTSRVLQNVTANASIITAGTISDDRLPASITSDITGNAATATKWATARTLTIGDTGKSVDGSGNVSWSRTELGITKTNIDALNIDADTVDGVQASQFLRSDTADTYSSTIKATGTNWYLWGLGARGASSGEYGIGNRNDDAYRQLTFHVPNQAAYGGTGTIPSFGWYSNGAVQLMKLEGGTGNLTLYDGDLSVGDGAANSRVIIDKADNNVSDHLIFEVGGTRVGEIGGQDTTWLRINQVTAKNIYTPRYMRADGGFYVDSTSYGINGSGRLLSPSLSGTYSNFLGFSGGIDVYGNSPAIKARGSDTEIILQSTNESAGNPQQFYIQHDYGSVNIGNSRGNILFNAGNVTIGNDLFVNDYARIDALRVGTTSTDPGDGNLYVEGNVTINGGSSGLLVDSANNASLRLDRGSTSYDNNLLFYTAGALKWRLWQDGSDDYLYIRDEVNSSNMVTFETGGNVGIGVTTPQSKLHVDGDIELGAFAGTSGGTIKLNGTTASKQSTIKTTNGNLHIDSEDGSSLYLNYYEGISGTGQNIYFGNGNGGNSGASVQGDGVINATAINTGQGDYELYAMNQNVRTTDAVTFATVNTGQGATEVYLMNQNVRSTDAVTFSTINTGQGATEVYLMNQNVRSTDAVTFSTINTGQGATEVYLMNQNVRSSDSVTFSTLTSTGGMVVDRAATNITVLEAYDSNDDGIQIGVNSGGDPYFAPIENGTKQFTQEFLWDTSADEWVIEDGLQVDGVLEVDPNGAYLYMNTDGNSRNLMRFDRSSSQNWELRLGSTGTLELNDIGASRTFEMDCIITKRSGTFKIKHPDPAKKETHNLYHSFVESPTAGDNIYRWQVEVVDGTAVVELPDYYKYLNENDQVWVSPYKHFGQAYGEVNEEQTHLTVTANADGLYNVLCIGTRKDEDAVKAWTGCERLQSES